MPKNKITIRKAKISDAKSLSQLTQSLSHFYLGDKNSRIPKWLEDSFAESQFTARLENTDYRHFIAEINNQIVGFIAIKQPNHLYHLFVDENYHGQGIGKQLWHYAVETLQLEKQDYITVRASLYAVPVYEKLGFEASDDVMEKDGLKFLAMKKTQNS